MGIIETRDAIRKAGDAGLDLVEVAPTADPPVCRIMDYGKWLYQQKRKVRESRKKGHHHSTLKEIRLRPETDPHDLAIKLDHAREFLEKGHRVQFTVFFRGRQILHQDKGYEMLSHISELMGDLSKVEQPSKISKRRMTLLLVPK